jgi:lysophospholipase L1-like esterase
MQVRPQDRIVFLGDSITEQNQYTQVVETYLIQRYPDWKLKFFNAGWSGNYAEGGSSRLERDVLALKPTLVTICFGTNDATYSEPWDGMEKWFADNLLDIIHRLKKVGARVVVLTPGVVDPDSPDLTWLQGIDYNHHGLKILSQVALDVAKAENLSSFDYHSLMQGVLDSSKKTEAKGFSWYGDGLHPDAAGGLIMAYAMLKALGVPDEPDGLQIADFGSRRGNAMTARVKLDHLPFFVGKDAQKALKYVPFEKEYGGMKVAFKGLEPGRWCLVWGEAQAMTLTAEVLADGVELGELWDTPAMKQSKALRDFILAKDEVYYDLWRRLAMPGDWVMTGPYDPVPHRLGMSVSEKLEPLEWEKAKPNAQGYEIALTKVKDK